MHYKVESIGAEFSNKDIRSLESLLTARASEGYIFHSVFQVQEAPGCLQFGQKLTTYLAVFVKE